MYNILFLLVLASIVVVQAWDFAVTIGEQLQFYDNGIKMQSKEIPFRDLTALTYDPLHETLIFVDKQGHNGSIFSYNLLTRNIKPLVPKKAYEENIQDLAVDPMKELLFWTDTNERSIYWISLKHGYENHEYGNLLFKMDNELPRSVAVDSCRGYVYWTNVNIRNSTIERSRYNSSKKEVVIDDNIYMPVSLTIDQQTKKMYWADDREGIFYFIESADLDGRNRITLLTGLYHQPNSLSVSKDFIYWADWGYKSVWQLRKNPPLESEPVQISNFYNKAPFGIAANYKIEDQIKGIEECSALEAVLPSTSKTSDSTTISNDKKLNNPIKTDYPDVVTTTISPFDTFKLNETTTSVPSVVNLTLFSKTVIPVGNFTRRSNSATINSNDNELNDLITTDNPAVELTINPINTSKPNETMPSVVDFILENDNTIPLANLTDGQRGIAICHNFCLNGKCQINSEGKPECRCEKLYIGNRCQTNVCYNYCLNNGVCVFGDKGAPTCSCPSDYEGSRCEIWTNPIALL